MSFKNSLAKVYDIMLTPTIGFYKASKGCESTCDFIITVGELKWITSGDCSDSVNQSSPKMKINSLITSLRIFKSSGCEKLGLKSLDCLGWIILW